MHCVKFSSPQCKGKHGQHTLQCVTFSSLCKTKTAQCTVSKFKTWIAHWTMSNSFLSSVKHKQHSALYQSVLNMDSTQHHVKFFLPRQKKKTAYCKVYLSSVNINSTVHCWTAYCTELNHLPEQHTVSNSLLSNVKHGDVKFSAQQCKT